MQHYTGYYYCTRSNWDGKIFSAGNLVIIGIEELDSDEDYRNLIVKKANPKYDFHNYDPLVGRTLKSLKPEVFQWLEENVKDEKKGVKGWCCGDETYPTNDMTYAVFFYRRKDARNFIKTWSVHKMPTKTYNQNTYVTKKLDLKTGRLKVVKKKL